MKLRLLFIALGIIIVAGLATTALRQANTGGTASQTTATPTPTPSPVATNAVSIKGMAFTPDFITIKQGTTVTWTNADGVAHTVTADAAGQPNSPASPTIPANGSYSFAFTSAGTFHYHCKFHADMTGTVIVTP